MQHRPHVAPITEWLERWINWLPVYEDREESANCYSFIAHLLENGHVRKFDILSANWTGDKFLGKTWTGDKKCFWTGEIFIIFPRPGFPQKGGGRLIFRENDPKLLCALCVLLCEKKQLKKCWKIYKYILFLKESAKSQSEKMLYLSAHSLTSEALEDNSNVQERIYNICRTAKQVQIIINNNKF